MHVPFCETKCPYCAFASSPMNNSATNGGDAGRYIDAVGRELASRVGGIQTFDTLYIGGGTPSILPIYAWETLLDLLGRYLNFARDAEITVEANPGSLEKNRTALWKDYGVNRVSVGVQSLNDDRLNFLGRIHDSRQAAEAIKLCLSAGFLVSLDMMFGLPGETLRDWMVDLREAIRLGPHHISLYQLSIENGTPFAERNFSLPEGYAQYRYAQWRLAQTGYAQYEVASFARPQMESRHNMNYWTGGDYIGIGPAAWSYLDGVRFRNAASLEEY
ncbi:MAG: radical SAM family heme chaperone HemW, partial [Synergistaceae bacterium]|nr:radical SAM family heme chaperone HemW [Synergistaceae bacterium]